VSLSWIARVCGSEEGGARGWRWESVPGGPEFVEFFQQLREMPNSKRFYECLRGGHAAQPVRYVVCLFVCFVCLFVIVFNIEQIQPLLHVWLCESNFYDCVVGD
jgi:hypothetical protein